MSRLAEKLLFSFKQDKIDPNDYLYAEQTIFGNVTISKNNLNQASKIDLELLFKATINNPDVFKGIF